MQRRPTPKQRQGVTVQIDGPGRKPVLRVELSSGVGTVLLQQAISSDPAGAGQPYALLQAEISYGIDGAHFSVVADWQMGTRIVIPGDFIDLTISYVPTDIARLPMNVTVYAAVVDGAPAPPTPWGFTVRCDQLAPLGTQVIQVPQGAHDVALYAPTNASWGGFLVRQQTANGLLTIVESAPTSPAPVALLPGVRWIQVVNNTPAALRPYLRFGLA